MSNFESNNANKGHDLTTAQILGCESSPRPGDLPSRSLLSGRISMSGMVARDELCEAWDVLCADGDEQVVREDKPGRTIKDTAKRLGIDLLSPRSDIVTEISDQHRLKYGYGDAPASLIGVIVYDLNEFAKYTTFGSSKPGRAKISDWYCYLTGATLQIIATNPEVDDDGLLDLVAETDIWSMLKPRLDSLADVAVFVGAVTIIREAAQEYFAANQPKNREV